MAGQCVTVEKTRRTQFDKSKEPLTYGHSIDLTTCCIECSVMFFFQMYTYSSSKNLLSMANYLHLNNVHSHWIGVYKDETDFESKEWKRI